jgi:plastocyanin
MTSLALVVAGCSGKGETADDATVTIPEPVSVGGTSTASAAASPTAASTPAEASKPGSTPPAEAAPVKAEGWGTLKGKVIFTGTPPPAKFLVEKGASNVKDAQVCAVNGIPSQRLEVDPESKGVRYAIVYIPKPTAVNPEAESAAKAEPVEFDQKGCVFSPHVLAVMKGQNVNLRSADAVGHNVNFKLIALRQNLSIQPGSAPTPIPAKVAERRPGEVVCDIHPWMKAWWMVTDNPYFAVTDAKGNFEIKNVPAGTQKVVVWQESVKNGGFVTSSSGDAVTIPAGGEVTKEFTFDQSKVNPE